MKLTIYWSVGKVLPGRLDPAMFTTLKRKDRSKSSMFKWIIVHYTNFIIFGNQIKNCRWKVICTFELLHWVPHTTSNLIHKNMH